MAKTWDQMTQAEKVEDLRRDMLRIFEALNNLSRNVNRAFADMDTKASQASKEIQEAARRLDSLEGKNS